MPQAPSRKVQSPIPFTPISFCTDRPPRVHMHTRMYIQTLRHSLTHSGDPNKHPLTPKDRNSLTCPAPGDLWLKTTWSWSLNASAAVDLWYVWLIHSRIRPERHQSMGALPTSPLARNLSSNGHSKTSEGYTSKVVPLVAWWSQNGGFGWLWMRGRGLFCSNERQHWSLHVYCRDSCLKRFSLTLSIRCYTQAQVSITNYTRILFSLTLHSTFRGFKLA